MDCKPSIGLMLCVSDNGFGFCGTTQGRSYSGELPDKAFKGTWAFISPSCSIMNKSSFIVSPTIAKSKSHFSKIARHCLSFSGFRTISIRSWDSESIIS